MCAAACPCYVAEVTSHTAVILILVLGLWLLVRSLQEKPPAFDVVGLVGAEGEALETFTDAGQISVRGEIWRATTKRGIIQRGDRVVVVAVAPELTLLVERKSQ